MGLSDYVPPIEDVDEIEVGDRLRFWPTGTGGRSVWWTVRARDDRFIVVTAPKPFTRRELRRVHYSVVDLTGWEEKRYNGAGGGPVRSSLNTLGGGWDLDGSTDRELEEAAEQIIRLLHRDDVELSHRRVINVRTIERKTP